MKQLLALLGVSLGIILAVPAHAEPGIDESSSDENNRPSSLTYIRWASAFATQAKPSAPAKRCAAHLHNGMSGLHLIKHLQENNPALTENGAAQFATISAKAYCPKQLEEEQSLAIST